MGDPSIMLPSALTLERLKGVHEVQVGLQRDQAWLDHVCIS